MSVFKSIVTNVKRHLITLVLSQPSSSELYWRSSGGRKHLARRQVEARSGPVPCIRRYDCRGRDRVRSVG